MTPRQLMSRRSCFKICTVGLLLHWSALRQATVPRVLNDEAHAYQILIGYHPLWASATPCTRACFTVGLVKSNLVLVAAVVSTERSYIFAPFFFLLGSILHFGNIYPLILYGIYLNNFAPL